MTEEGTGKGTGSVCVDDRRSDADQEYIYKPNIWLSDCEVSSLELNRYLHGSSKCQLSGGEPIFSIDLKGMRRCDGYIHEKGRKGASCLFCKLTMKCSTLTQGSDTTR